MPYLQGQAEKEFDFRKGRVGNEEGRRNGATERIVAWKQLKKQESENMAKIHFQTQQANLKCAAADVATAKKKKKKKG